MKKYYVTYVEDGETHFLHKQEPTNLTFQAHLNEWLTMTEAGVLPGNLIKDSSYAYTEGDLEYLPPKLLVKFLLEQDKFQLFDEDDFKQIVDIFNEKAGPLLALLRLQADQDEDKGEDE